MTTDLMKIGVEPLLPAVRDTVPDGVTVIDRDLRVVFRKEMIRTMYGDIEGRYCQEAYRGRDEPCPDCTILEVLQDGEPRRTLEDTRLPNGDVVWMECSSGALRDDAGAIVGAVELLPNVTEQVRLTEECATLRREVRRQVDIDNIITQSKAIKALFRVISRVAPTRSSVLITGESGTGKELFAKAIWQNSDRRDRPFVPVNCSAMSRPEVIATAPEVVHERFGGAASAPLLPACRPRRPQNTALYRVVSASPTARSASLHAFPTKAVLRRLHLD